MDYPNKDVAPPTPPSSLNSSGVLTPLCCIRLEKNKKYQQNPRKHCEKSARNPQKSAHLKFFESNTKLHISKIQTHRGHVSRDSGPILQFMSVQYLFMPKFWNPRSRIV